MRKLKVLLALSVIVTIPIGIGGCIDYKNETSIGAYTFSANLKTDECILSYNDESIGVYQHSMILKLDYQRQEDILEIFYIKEYPFKTFYLKVYKQGRIVLNNTYTAPFYMPVFENSYLFYYLGSYIFSIDAESNIIAINKIMDNERIFSNLYTIDSSLYYLKYNKEDNKYVIVKLLLENNGYGNQTINYQISNDEFALTKKYGGINDIRLVVSSNGKYATITQYNSMFCIDLTSGANFLKDFDSFVFVNDISDVGIVTYEKADDIAKLEAYLKMKIDGEESEEMEKEIQQWRKNIDKLFFFQQLIENQQNLLNIESSLEAESNRGISGGISGNSI